jgi:hypothetical protein
MDLNLVGVQRAERHEQHQRQPAERQTDDFADIALLGRSATFAEVLLEFILFHHRNRLLERMVKP